MVSVPGHDGDLLQVVERFWVVSVPGHDGDLRQPVEQNGGGEADERHHRPGQELHLPHQHVAGLRPCRDLLHEVEIHLEIDVYHIEY